jgi:hypothetical protein
MTLHEASTLPSEHLPDENRAAWQSALRSWPFPTDLRGMLKFFEQSKRVALSSLPARVVELLRNFSTASGPIAILLDNLPTGKLGPTPKDGQRPASKDSVSEAVLAGILQIVGFPMAWTNEKLGELFQQIVPLDGVNGNTNGARNTFQMHSDNPFVDARFRQQIIALNGLRNPSRAATLLLPITDILAAMDPALEAALRRPVVRFPAPLSFELGGWSVLTEPRPVIYTAHGTDHIAANVYSMEPTKPGDTVVLEFRALVESLAPRRIVVDAGTMLIFRDDRALHGRDEFRGDRWLQRAYARFDLTPLQQVAGTSSSTYTFDARDFIFR